MEPVNADRSGSPTMLAADDQPESSEETDHLQKERNDKRAGWVSALVYIMRQSYVLSLIAMMVCMHFMTS